LIIGSPTDGALPREAIQALVARIGPPALAGARAATFDTRLTWGFLARYGFAADRIADALQGKGWTLVGQPGGFLVKGLRKGPLKRGELERAAAWAKEIVEASA
jgi:flavodoxin